MDVNCAILKSIIEGNHSYTKIFSNAEKIHPMSRVTFDKHLKLLVSDKYVTKKERGKQIVEYQIYPDAMTTSLGLIKDEGEKEFDEWVEQICNSDISKIPKKTQNDLIRYFDESLLTNLTQQNLGTLIIHALHQGEMSMKDSAIKGRDKNDKKIAMILKIIKKINPDVYELYPAFTFHLLEREPVSVLSDKLISNMEVLGKLARIIKEQRKNKTKK